MDFAPIPLAGSACSIYLAIDSGDASGIVFGVATGLLDIFTFGMGHYLVAVGKDISKLARLVQKGGQIVRGISIGSK